MRKQSRYRIGFLFVLIATGIFLRHFSGLVNSQTKSELVISRVANLQIKPAITFPSKSYVRGITLIYVKSEQTWGLSYTVLTETAFEDVVKYYKQRYNSPTTKWLTDGTKSRSGSRNILAFTVFEDHTKRKHVFTITAGPPSAGDIEDFELEMKEQKQCCVIAVYIDVPLLREIQQRGGYMPINIPMER